MVSKIQNSNQRTVSNCICISLFDRFALQYGTYFTIHLFCLCALRFQCVTDAIRLTLFYEIIALGLHYIDFVVLVITY